MSIILWNKKYTETLSETLKRFRYEQPQYTTEKVTYAGRLDPMAEGLLILLTGDDVHRKNEFLNHHKTYEVEFFFGVETDTYDILGDINSLSWPSEIDDVKLEAMLGEMSGRFLQKYPPYSSKPVQGKPLFEWARESRLDEINIPTKEVEIFNINLIGKKNILLSDLKDTILHSVKEVKGDFRQFEIAKAWGKMINYKENEYICIYSIRVSASSGTYMRSIIHQLGKINDLGACSLKIKRLQIGDYKL